MQQVDILENLKNVHYLPGPILKDIVRVKAENCMKTNELEAIHRLVESHVPTLRYKANMRLEKILTSIDTKNVSSSRKNYFGFNCSDSKIADGINAMLSKIKEMPPEWTMVQITSQFNCNENLAIDNQHFTNALYITVFNCGENQVEPFCVTVDAPKDPVNGNIVSLVEEMYTIMAENRSVLTSAQGKLRFNGLGEKLSYYEHRRNTDNRMMMLVKDLQDLYLKEWKCLFCGKYVDNKLEAKILIMIETFFKTEGAEFDLDEKTKAIVLYLIKAYDSLKLSEVKNALQNICVANKKLQISLAQFIRNTSQNLSLASQPKHPLILILDDNIDCFPWEMMEILNNVSVSRVPSLHIAYSLFQEHKETIRNGFKIVENPKNGAYVVNPDLDLNSMQNRILSFFEYWVPEWKGVSGCAPSLEQFEKMLVSAEIFSYNGHGSGSHHFPSYKVEKVRINSVVLLFGCSSTKLNILGPGVEMYSAYQIYLIACSPCVVGNLWEVTDLDTDILSTEFLSRWIPNREKLHFIHVDKTKWKKGEKVEFEGKIDSDCSSVEAIHEPELLKALSSAKKSPSLNFYITKAAIVARGIPVKIAAE